MLAAQPDEHFTRSMAKRYIQNSVKFNELFINKLIKKRILKLVYLQ